MKYFIYIDLNFFDIHNDINDIHNLFYENKNSKSQK